MATLAVMLKECGYQVSGSDTALYPPMSEFLARHGIEVDAGYDATNLSAAPDLVIVGNAVSRDNPEVVGLLGSELDYVSFPQAVAKFFLENKRRIVVAGTHGKTTSTAMLAWILEQAGRLPGMLVGGISRNFNSGYAIGEGGDFVIEGDEYDSAFFDKGPKFLHYLPSALLLNGIEFDHADIYKDLEQIKRAFSRLLDIVPGGAPIVACNHYPEIRKVLEASGQSYETFGIGHSADWQAHDVLDDGSNTTFRVTRYGSEYGDFVSPLMGRMNVLNALGVIALCSHIEISPTQAQAGLANFRGVERRQELVGTARGVTIVDDFAHHPTAVRVSIEALRMRFPGRRLWAIFEPRSNTCRRKIFQAPLADALGRADRAIVGEVIAKPQDPVDAEDMFSTEELAATLQSAGHFVEAGLSPTQIADLLDKDCLAGDVVLIMSNGPFGGLPRKVMAVLDHV